MWDRVLWVGEMLGRYMLLRFLGLEIIEVKKVGCFLMKISICFGKKIIKQVGDIVQIKDEGKY